MSPELPTVVATKPPTVLGGASEGSGARHVTLTDIPESSSEQTVASEESLSSTSAPTEAIAEPAPSDAVAEQEDSFSTPPETKPEALPSPLDGELTSGACE